MTRLRRIRRYFALHTYVTRLGWRYFKNDVVELWQYWFFRLAFRRAKSLPFRVLALLHSKRVPKDHGFGKYGEKEAVMYLPPDHPIFDPKNDHLFTAEAARQAFSHVDLPGQEEAEIAEQCEERLANFVIGGIALCMLVAFAVAVASILFMK